MTTIVTRAGKGSPLTHTEVDTNFTNLNTNKLETAAIPLGTLAAPSISFLSDANTGIYSPAADTVAFVTAGSNRVHITSGGLVGIGTSAPSSLLHLVSSGQPTITVADDGGRTLQVKAPDGSANPGFVGTTTNHDLLIQAGTTAGGLNIMRFNTAGAERVRITDTGRVGIGTTSPGQSLDVNGNIRVGSNQKVMFGPASYEASIKYATNGNFQIAARSGESITFNNGEDGTERARIDSSGRLLVGTGTNSTSAPLESFRLTGQTSGVYEIGAFTSCALVGGGGVSTGFGGQISLGIKDDNGYSTLGAITYQTDAGQTSYGRLALQNKRNGTLEDILVAQHDRTLHFPQVGTTASSANAFLNSASSPANQLLRSTSSLRYKTGIENIDEERSAAILGFRPVWYRSLASADRNDWSWYGLIAEEVAEIEPRLVHWTYLEDAYEEIDGEKQLKPDAEMVPDGVQYDRLTVLLLDVVKRQQQAIETLEQRLTAAGID